MSKRDRAARAKNAGSAGADAGDPVADDLELDDSPVEADADTGSDAGESAEKELVPTGKRSGRRRSSTAASTTDDDADAGSAVAVKERKKTKKPAAESNNPIVRIWVFLQQVVSELKKVIWPSRRDIVVYTIVVLVFVAVMTAFIFGLDLGFAKAVLWLFG